MTTLRECADVSGRTLSEQEFMDLLDIRKSTYYARKKEGRYRFLEVTKGPDGKHLGHKTEYSGALVQRWRDGVGTASAFGQRRLRIAR